MPWLFLERGLMLLPLDFDISIFGTFFEVWEFWDILLLAGVTFLDVPLLGAFDGTLM